MGLDKTKSIDQDQSDIRQYESPSIRVMDEQEVLSAFQVTVAAITWWGM